MQIRILGGCKRLLMAAAITSLIAAPTVAATGSSGMGLKPGSATTTQVPDTADQPRIKQPILFPRANYVWQFASGPVYGEVGTLKANSAGVLHTRVGSFDLTRGLPNFPVELRKSNQLATLGVQYFVLQVNPESFTDGGFDDVKGRLEAQGAVIVQEMPVGAFLVRMTSGAFNAVKGFPSVLALEPYQPAMKLSPEIGRIPLTDPIKAVSDVYSLELRLFPGEDSARVAKALTDLGVQVTRAFSDTVYVNADKSKLASIAGLEPIVAINEALPIYPHSEETTSTVQTGRWNIGATPYNDQGIDGRCADAACAGPQVLMILDTGIQADAGDLSNTRADGNSVTPFGAAHRKVIFYGTSNAFGGTGDLLGCDAGPAGGFTHGHTVAVTALGNATKVQAAYGAGWQAPDTNDNPWDLDGLAPRAKLVAYDAGLTPLTGSCDDPHNPAATAGIFPGDLYAGGVTGSLGDGYAKGARVTNFSWGSESNAYTANSIDIDQFIFDKGDAMVFISAGNNGIDTGVDGVGEPRTVGTPATAKNGITVGASNNANDQFDVRNPEVRAGFSAMGPSGSTLKYRTSPLLMAPGNDNGAMGLDSEFNCRSTDNDQSNPVGCDIVQGLSGTSFASPAAAGAALLVRDYFAQGFYPDGTASNPGNAADKVGNISGALLKSVLIASADYMDDVTPGKGGALDFPWRFSNEQGYGRITLTNALPLQTYPQAVSGLIVADGGIGGGVNNTTLSTTLAAGASTSTAVNVCDTSQPLSIGLSWIEAPGEDVARDLDLELLSPSGRKYIGNFYTDNENSNSGVPATGDETLDPGEGCDFTGQPWPENSVGIIDNSPWSLPVQSCPNASADTNNPTEGIHLSADPALNGIVNDPLTAVNEGADNQLESGTWTLTVKANAGNGGPQNYAVAISGGVCLGSSVRVQRVAAANQLVGGTFVCNDSAVVTVNEIATGGDPAGTLTPAEISSRTTVQVVDAGVDGAFATADDVVVDTESGLTFTDFDGGGAGLRFDSNKILLTDGTAADPGNNVLDVRSGQQIRVTYQDENPNGVVDPNAKRVNVGTVDCRATIAAGGVVFGQFGKDAFTLVSGGCEKDARGYFTFGFPDRFMDAGELVGYLVAFQSAETGTTLQDVTVSLKAVSTDADSPADCKPGAVTCADPNRANNPVSPFLTVLDSPKVLGTLPAGSTVTPSFTIQVAGVISGVQQADMILGVSAKTAGKGVESIAVQRETLNVDGKDFFYNTDFPTGGFDPVGGVDFNNNEVLETVTNDPASFVGDYNFETRSYSDLTAGGFNTTAGLRSPWNFDTNDGGFTSGIQNGSRSGGTTMAWWGEDKNFNGRLDGFCFDAVPATIDPPCTQGLASETCLRCANDPTQPCVVAGDCPGSSCISRGTCTYTLDEDRDIAANGQLDRNWGTRGGCGWQTRGAITTGGIWHTGRVDVTSVATCLAAGTTSARCQNYERHPIGDALGDIYNWEMLLTPVINKVNQCTAIGPNCPRVDVAGDPVFQVAITDWAWNMSIDIADQNSAILTEFDTDLDKLEGADFYNDFALTNIALFGVQGAVSGGNAPIMNGYNMFAPISKCTDTDGNGTLDHCSRANGAVCTSDAGCTGNDTNGTLGGSRNGDNNCSFEGKVAGVIRSKTPYGLAIPADDDVTGGYCLRSDSLNNFDKSVACVNNTICTNAGAPYTTCFKPDAVIDEFVQTNGPGRNYGMQVPNGPDMRFTTLEDFYGDSGTRFQAAVGFYNSEPIASTTSPNVSGYGLGIDDMFISWKETRLDEDTTNCAGNAECADIEIKSTLAYDAASLVEVTVTDKTPYDAVNNKNDCNGNNVYSDPGDDQDCNNNGALDVTVKLTSAVEPAGEIAVLDQVSPGNPRYTVRFPYSASYNSPGSIFVQRSGTANPVITAQYEDRNDGTGSRCKNALELEQQGFIRANATIGLIAGRITFKAYAITLAGGSPGDNDGFADADETVDMTLTLINKSGLDVDDLTATLATSDSKIVCITKPVVSIGSVLDKATVVSPPFRFKVGGVAQGVNRTNINDVLQTTFVVTIRSNKFDTLSRSIEVTIDLDLNASGAGTNAPFVEDFEGAGLGQFTLQTLDAGKNSLILSDGMRCQYNDPFGLNSNSPNRAECFLGFSGDAPAGVNDWHIQANNAANCNSGRSFTGTQSLRWGLCPSGTASTAARDTTRFRQLDAVQTTDPINLPLAGGTPELTFKHQVSLIDNRNITNIDAGETVDRGVVQLQLADDLGNPVGNWIKIVAYENEYDQQGTDDFTNCVFDPTDDGNDEDDFNDPTDPLRRLGPSSTCFPEFVYARSGDTDWRLDFNVANVGLSEGPGLPGNQAAGFRNPGTWVQPKFNLLAFAGRRIRVRFLGTTIELGDTATWDDQFQVDNVRGDDGWFIDDVHIDGALSGPLTISVDTASLSGLGCGTCSTITPDLTATPTPPLSGPGQIVTLSAKNSTIDVCNNGVPQYQFWIDTNNDSIIGNAGDELLRDFTDNSSFVDAPQVTTDYGVVVRCSTATSCDSGPGDNPSNAKKLHVQVNCPASGNAKGPFLQSLRVDKASLAGAEPDPSVSVSWANPQTVDVVKGNLITLRSSVGNYTGTVLACIGNNIGPNSVADATNPGAGGAQYFLARPITAQFCNQVPAYTTLHVKEAAGRDAEINADGNSCAP